MVPASWRSAPTSPSRGGRLVILPVDSQLLRGNGLGDPHVRELPVWLPPGYDESDERYPTAWCLTGFLGRGDSHISWKPWAEQLPARLDRLLDERRIGPMIVAFPDCFTKMGGSQYINSSTCGPYSDHLCRELVPLVDRSLRTLASREHRAVFGKSSGGFGAMVQAMLNPEVWGALACHSGDSAFELCFFTDFPRAINEINRRGGLGPFLRDFYGKKKRSGSETHTMMLLAMAACFDPLPEQEHGFLFPADLHTGRLIPERWERWLAWDPALMIPRHLDALRSLSLVFIDCGFKDQYHLHYGARRMAEALELASIPHDYEEFPDNHSSVNYRMDRSLPKLYEAIRASG